MKLTNRLIIRLYDLLLRLCPRDFRHMFGEEMTAVFTSGLAGALRKGPFFWLLAALAEYADLVRTAGRLHWGAMTRGSIMMNETINTDQAGTPAMLETNEPIDRRDVWLAALPFILSGLLYVLKGFDYDALPLERWLGSTILWQLAVHVLLVVGLAVGWARGFPRWSYSYLGMVLMQAFWLAGVRTYGFRLFGYTFREPWAWRAWLPLIVMSLLLMSLFGPSAWARLFRDVRRDWTRLSFTLYGALVWLLMGALYDNKTWYSNTLLLPLDMLALTLVTTLGAWYYMRADRMWRRAVALQVAYLLIFLKPSFDEIDGRYSIHLAPILFWNALLLLPCIPSLIRTTMRKARPA